MPSHLPFPFLVGVPRSGTTLLRLMLDAHPELAIPPETGFLAALPGSFPRIRTAEALCQVMTRYPRSAPNWADFNMDAGALRKEMDRIRPFDVAEGVRTFYRIYAAGLGKSRFGDKTPTYGDSMRRIERLLPEVCWVHIIRDGRDVALSLRKTWFAPSQEMSKLAAYWKGGVERAQRAGRNAASYMEVRYEELVLNPQPVLAEICRRIGLGFDPAMLSYWQRARSRLEEHKSRHEPGGDIVVTREERLEQQRLTMHPPQPSRVGAWRGKMTETERGAFESVAGGLLKRLGYLG